MTKINQNAYVNPEAKQILKSKIGYRCLDQTDSDYHNPKDIILFETNELGNTDIGETMLKLMRCMELTIILKLMKQWLQN